MNKDKSGMKLLIWEAVNEKTECLKHQKKQK